MDLVRTATLTKVLCHSAVNAREHVIRFQSRKPHTYGLSSAVGVHNAQAPIEARLFSIAFFHRGTRSLAYLNGCGKYLQLPMYGTSQLEPHLT